MSSTPSGTGTDLLSTALLGTDRRPSAGVSDPTRSLLDQAVRRRVERQLAGGMEPCPPPPVAPPADVAEPPPVARELLAEILLRLDTTALNLWLSEAREHDCGLAPEQWTAVLDRARHTAGLDRRLLGAALGARGRWFAAQNPAWRSACRAWDEPEPGPEQQSGPTSDTTAAARLRLARAFDPATAAPPRSTVKPVGGALR